MAKMKVGVFSPNDPREWVRQVNTDGMLRMESLLIDALKKNDIEVVRGGEGLPKMDQVAWNRQLVITQAKALAKAKPDVLILNFGDWAWPRDSVDALDIFEAVTREIYGDSASAPALLWGYKEPTVPGLVAVMATSGALRTMGRSHLIAYGLIDKDPAVVADLMKKLDFLKRRVDAVPVVKKAVAQLPYQKYQQFGGESLKMPTATADPNLWQQIFKVTYEQLDQSVLVDRSLKMVKWAGQPGDSDYEILDPRVKAAMEHREKAGNIDYSRSGLQKPAKLVLQVALFYATRDIMEEQGGTFAGIKCQEELSSYYCTACIATSYLGNDVGPDGKPQKIYPCSCENDMDTALSQLMLYLLSGQPSGFGDFRDVEDNKLAIVNCGQHPAYFFGGPKEPGEVKDARAEFMGQEIWYRAGGSSVRGRTPGGHVMTVARLGRDNMKYYLAGSVINTVDVPVSQHSQYSVSWPIIRGSLVMPDEQIIAMWPSNHLAFTFGDWTPHLVELAEALNIGYKIVDANGVLHTKPA